MSKIGDWLRSAGLLPKFTQDDILNAETDDALREVEKGREAVEKAYAGQRASTEKLRSTMREVRQRAATFGQFEDRIRHRTTRGH